MTTRRAAPPPVTGLKELNDELMSYIKTLEIGMKSKDQEIEQQQRDLLVYKKKLDDAVVLMDSMSSKSDFDDNADILHSLLKEKSNLQGQLLLLQSSHDSLTDQVQNLERECRSVTAERNALTVSVEELNFSLTDTAERGDRAMKQHVFAMSTMREELSRYALMEDDVAQLQMRLEIMEVDNVQLKDSLARAKDIGEDAQQEVFNANDRIVLLEEQVDGHREQNNILQVQMRQMENTIVSLKSEIAQANASNKKLQSANDTMTGEIVGLRDEITQLRHESLNADAKDRALRLENEVKALKSQIVLVKGKESDRQFELEALRSKFAEHEKSFSNSKRAWEEEKASFIGENDAMTVSLASLRGEYEALGEVYARVMHHTQTELSEMCKEATESRNTNRSLVATILKLKSKVTRQCEFNLDADDNLKKELLKMFEVIGDRAELASRAVLNESKKEQGEVEDLRMAKDELEEKLMQSNVELRKEKARYDQAVAESNFSIIDLKREKKALTDMLDDRDEKARSYVAQIDEGRATIEQLRSDMSEARDAYEDLSRSTMDMIERAQHDNDSANVDRSKDAALVYELKAELSAKEEKVQKYKEVIQSMQDAEREGGGDSGVSSLHLAADVKDLAQKLAHSQQLVQSLHGQKAALLEQLIELASLQEGRDGVQQQQQQQQQQQRELERMSPNELALSSEDEDEDEDEEDDVLTGDSLFQ
jgi:chromosome segregation ATPase